MKYDIGIEESSLSVAVDYTYNIDNMLTGFTTSGAPPFSLSGVTVDGLGRLWAADETITDAGQNQIQHSSAFEYDMRSQLLYAEMTDVGSLDWVSDTYSYDRAGNVQSHSYDTSDDPPAETAYDFLGDLMTQAGDTSIDWGITLCMWLVDKLEEIVYSRFPVVD